MASLVPNSYLLSHILHPTCLILVILNSLMSCFRFSIGHPWIFIHVSCLFHSRSCFSCHVFYFKITFRYSLVHGFMPCDVFPADFTCHVFIGLSSCYVVISSVLVILFSSSVLSLVVFVMCLPIVLNLSPHVCHVSLLCIELKYVTLFHVIFYSS